MSWKIYALGTATSASGLSKLVLPKLQELGYGAAYTNIGNTNGTLEVTIDGTVFSADMYVNNTTSYPVFLCVNDETNEIVIVKYGSSENLSASSSLCIAFCFAILHGTNVITGETGLIPVTPGHQAYNLTNAWFSSKSTGIIMMQRAMFKACESYILAPFVSNLFWGDVSLTPGAVITVGTDNFVCLNQCLYAKL